MKKKRLKLKKWSAIQTGCFIFLCIYAASLLYMYLWGAITSLKTNFDFRHNIFGLPSGKIWEWQWKNYKTAFEEIYVTVGIKRVYLLRMMFNSIFYSLIGAFLGVFSTWLVSYAIAKFPYKFSHILYRFIIIMMLIPILGTLPSALHIYRDILGLYDNWWYVIVSSIGISGGSMLIFYAFFLGIGENFVEAAKIDGAGNFTILFKIIFPLSGQMFLIMMIQAFIPRWNDYMVCVVWIPSIPTLAYGIFRFSDSMSNVANWPPMQITGCVMLMVPMLVVFIALKNKLMGNIRVGAIK